MKIIKTEKEYQKTLERLGQIFDFPENSKEGQEAELLMLLVQTYEAKHFPISFPDPISAIKTRMEDLNLKAKDLVNKGVFSKAGASLILNKKRPLTLSMIRKLNSELGLPVELLIQEYQLINLKGKTKEAI